MSSVPRCTQQESRLGELLDEEYFLSKILKHLVDDGLHECSRVCRRWRSLSLRMHPRLARVPWEKMPDAASKFPNATSVSVDTEASTDVLYHHPDVFTRFPNIQQLSTKGEYPPKDVSFSLCLHSALSVALPSLQRLLSLSVRLHSDQSYSETTSALKHLTNLTHLWVMEPKDVDIDLEPFNDMHKIEELCVGPSLLIDRKGQLVFPGLTNLTRLELTSALSRRTRPQCEGRLLEVTPVPLPTASEEACVHLPDPDSVRFHAEVVRRHQRAQ